MNYSYPLVLTGFRWNLLKRCLYEIGIEPIGISDVGKETVLTFSRKLTLLEKDKLDTLMDNDPQNPPSYGTHLYVVDIQENLSIYPGLRLFFTESIKNSRSFDRLCFWHPDKLTQEQKDRIKQAYFNLYLG